ncbi:MULTISPECIES: acyl-CoA reductase [Sphingobacterium]|uniref:acyl-CoA reductase n=1 Tax=Sphingobacterium TaxID=28453 RepID=UPI0013D9F32E|nr:MULTISPECIES: acyl-CoA reductase [unclassified Sphingobacterium]
MTKQERIAAFAKLGEWLIHPDEETRYFIAQLYAKNAWYTTDNVIRQMHTIGNNLTQEKLTTWISAYQAEDSSKAIGLVLAGNLPLVGFHDILCGLLMGFNVQLKASSDDAGLTPYVVNKLIQISPSFAQKIAIVDKLSDFDLVIATGSNNSARYFEYYFGHKPNIIRKNRNSVAILTGEESQEQIAALGNDIFDYFGLGCRSVSKIYVPKGYSIATFFEGIEHFSGIKDHFKYNNNYDYNKSIYLINKDKHYDNGFLLLKEDSNLSSPLAVVFYEEYNDIKELEELLKQQQENIQCVVSQHKLDIPSPLFQLGQGQYPALDDYADGIDTLDFLAQHQ